MVKRGRPKEGSGRKEHSLEGGTGGVLCMGNGETFQQVREGKIERHPSCKKNIPWKEGEGKSASERGKREERREREERQERSRDARKEGRRKEYELEKREKGINKETEWRRKMLKRRTRAGEGRFILIRL
ncbi:hypothetical protein RF55_5128 [Lasius niger]|uniref:Uncharacterized protein n=1 Tax=Lasius niger TaxID=67767 RepID=A0A0J7KWS2_LASNI|nr:hypothetical protein RF55_5128 [Lasius niger]